MKMNSKSIWRLHTPTNIEHLTCFNLVVWWSTKLHDPHLQAFILVIDALAWFLSQNNYSMKVFGTAQCEEHGTKITDFLNNKLSPWEARCATEMHAQNTTYSFIRHKAIQIPSSSSPKYMELRAYTTVECKLVYYTNMSPNRDPTTKSSGWHLCFMTHLMAVVYFVTSFIVCPLSLQFQK